LVSPGFVPVRFPNPNREPRLSHLLHHCWPQLLLLLHYPWAALMELLHGGVRWNQPTCVWFASEVAHKLAIPTMTPCFEKMERRGLFVQSLTLLIFAFNLFSSSFFCIIVDWH
jgi:hypothetical protein